MVKGTPITMLRGGGKTPLLSTAQIEQHLEYLKLRARFQRVHYLALIEQEFEPSQALELCKTT